MKVDRELLKKYNKPGPRYTSYPPANFFSDKFTEKDFIDSVVESNDSGQENISLYIHIPFCPQLCYFCGCNSGEYKDDDYTRIYINAVKTEINRLAELLDKERRVTQIHWGGGTPNSIPMNMIAEVMSTIQSLFKFSEKPEIAMECSPAYLEFDHVDFLFKTGFNRLSLGVQDFNPEVLEKINRRTPLHPIEEIVAKIKATGFESVNLDFVYGLPGQDIDSFKETLERAVKISPDRMVTFSYAHVPWVKDTQKQLEKYKFPTPHDKLSMLELAHQFLTESGYRAIGMDHFGRSDDELYDARMNKKLHRNFQGYCTRETTGQVYGFGATSIAQLGNAYGQNFKNVEKYIKAIDAGGFAVEKGYVLTREERVVREVITEIMCNSCINFKQLSDELNMPADEIKSIIDFKEEKLTEFIDDGLIDYTDGVINITESGYFFMRNVAMLFDPNLQTGKGKYSQTV